MRLPRKLPALLSLLKVAIDSPGVKATVELAGVESNQPQFLLQLDSQAYNGLQTRVKQPASYLFHRGTCSECHFATFFSLVGDQLLADGELVTASEGSICQPLLETSTTGAIRHGFSLESGILQWRDPKFSGGNASFCLSTSNKVLVVFDESSRPASCTPTNLLYVPYAQCFPQITISLQTNNAGCPQRAGGSVGGSRDHAVSKWTDVTSDISKQHHGSSGSGSTGTEEPRPPGWPEHEGNRDYPDSGPRPLGPPGVAGLPTLHSQNGWGGRHGRDGADGKDGNDGRDGKDGKDGTQGPPGPPGPAGLNGTDGEPGKTGATGQTGSVGPGGPSGPPGPTGPSGLNGTDGEPGQTGPMGPTGSVGPEGPQGLAGPQGLTGPAGPPGVSGFADQYGYLGCYVADNDGNFGLKPYTWQQILTTSIDDCAASCADRPSGRSLYFTLGTNANGDSLCTCGDILDANFYPNTGLYFQCNRPCNFPDGPSGERYCGGTFATLPAVSVFGAI